jgi:hypothetical protein
VVCFKAIVWYLPGRCKEKQKHQSGYPDCNIINMKICISALQNLKKKFILTKPSQNLASHIHDLATFTEAYLSMSKGKGIKNTVHESLLPTSYSTAYY